MNDPDFHNIATMMTRRRLLAGLGLVGVAGMLSCTGRSTEPTSTATSAGFPVQITQQFGTAELTGPATRVVTLGLQYTDTLLAFGVQPVAWALDSESPWPAAELAPNPDANLTPGVFGNYELNYELIAASAPHAILTSDFYLGTQAGFNRLSSIAPTVDNMGVHGVAIDTWRNIARIVGKVLGAQAKADELIRSTETKIKNVTDSIPGLDETTYCFVAIYQGALNVGVEGDSSYEVLTDLGLTLSPGLESIDAGPGTATLSMERLDLLDGDVLLVTSFDDGGREQLEADSRFQALPAVRKGANLWVDVPVATRLHEPSLVSVPHVLDVITPTLRKGAES